MLFFPCTMYKKPSYRKCCYMPVTKNRLYLLILCSLFAALCAIGAFIKVPLAWLPITLQTFFSTLAGLLLGKKWGTVSVVVYLLLGLIGLPIFTQGGGIGYVTKPTFGFLLGLAPATFCTGLLFERSRKSWSSAFFASLAGAVILYVVFLGDHAPLSPSSHDGFSALCRLLFTHTARRCYKVHRLCQRSRQATHCAFSKTPGITISSFGYSKGERRRL